MSQRAKWNIGALVALGMFVLALGKIVFAAGNYPSRAEVETKYATNERVKALEENLVEVKIMVKDANYDLKTLLQRTPRRMQENGTTWSR